MGFDAGISINKFKHDNSGKITIFFLGRLNECLDRLIYHNCSNCPSEIECGEPIIPDDGPAIVKGYQKKVIKNEGYEYTFTREDIQPILNIIRPLYKITAKYSPRVINELENYIDGYSEEKPIEVSKEDISIIRDTLYNIGEAGDTDEPELHKAMRVYEIFAAIDEFDDEFFEEFGPLIYWRSW